MVKNEKISCERLELFEESDIQYPLNGIHLSLKRKRNQGQLK